MTKEIQVKLHDVDINPKLKEKQYTAIVQMDLIADSVQEAHRWIFDKLAALYDIPEPGPMCLKAILQVRNKDKVVADRDEHGIKFVEDRKQ